MKSTVSRLTLAAACLSLGGAAFAGFSGPTNIGPMSVHPEAMPGGEFAAPAAPAMPSLPGAPSQSVTPPILPPVAPVGPVAETPAVEAPSAMGHLRHVAAGFSNNNGGGFQPGSGPSAPSIGQQHQAGAQTFDGAARQMVSASDLDGFSSWYDQHTGQYETQQTKIAKAYQLAMSHPLAAAMKNNMPQNTVYKADNSHWGDDVRYVARTYGDDPEHAAEPAVTVFTRQAIQQMSPAYLAAHLARTWTLHMYRDKMPASAEKTYVSNSVMIRVFMALTGSQGQQYWNYDQDRPVLNALGRETFEIFSHWFHWAQGSSFQNVRQGPYFLNKIMRAEGDPTVDADARGRMTLHQREAANQITGQQAVDAQGLFDGFVSNER